MSIWNKNSRLAGNAVTQVALDQTPPIPIPHSETFVSQRTGKLLEISCQCDRREDHDYVRPGLA